MGLLREAHVLSYIEPVEQISDEIRIGYSDKGINALLDSIDERVGGFSRHFSQSEEFFVLLEDEFAVPHFPIHHDVRVTQPDQEYLEKLHSVLARIAELAPQLLKELVYFFDPAETLRPSFFKIYRVEESYYLYLLRIDLMMRPSMGTVIERGTNDTTPHYRTRKLFMESVIIPLEDVIRDDGKVKAFKIKQSISQSWIGEQGRGYFVQGIWMDQDLTKFFSKLFLPDGMRTYPFFPYLCKYKTVCQSVINLNPEGRKSTIPYFHRAMQFLAPLLEKIQAVMKNASFSEDNPFFRELKSKVPEKWFEAWKNIRVETYLNESDMREFRVEG
jgi:hypothetical protein